MFAWAPIIELRLITKKEMSIEIIPFVWSRGGLIPHARPMIKDPRFGNKNSDREIFANSFVGVDTAESHVLYVLKILFLNYCKVMFLTQR